MPMLTPWVNFRSTPNNTWSIVQTENRCFIQRTKLLYWLHKHIHRVNFPSIWMSKLRWCCDSIEQCLSNIGLSWFPSIKQKYMLVKHFFQFKWGKPACLRVCCSTSVATNIWTDFKLWSTSVTTSTTLLFPNQLHLESSLDIVAKMLIEYYSLLNKMSVWRPPTGQRC